MNHPQRPSTGTAAPPEIASLEDLRAHLQQAFELEHAALPPYLCALCSLDPERNPAAEALRDVVDAKVLRIALAAPRPGHLPPHENARVSPAGDVLVWPIGADMPSEHTCVPYGAGERLRDGTRSGSHRIRRLSRESA